MKQSFFRSIRHKLLGEGKLLRYLTYAVGEIILIILGILFALKINDWNEENKAREVETKILTEIRSNLLLDLEEIREDIVLHADVQTSCAFVLQYLETEDAPIETLFMHVGNLRINPHFDPNHSGYDLLKSKGVEIVLNDDLRRAISDLYESAYHYYYRYEQERTQFNQQNIFPVLLKHFSWDKRQEENRGQLDYGQYFVISQKDYTALRDDPGFRQVVKGLNFEYNMIRNRAERTEGIIVELIAQLNEELGIASKRMRTEG